MNFKKLAALLCVASMLMVPLASCAEKAVDESKESDSAPAVESTEPVVEDTTEAEEDISDLFPKMTDDLPDDINLDGRTVTFLGRSYWQDTMDELYVEETTGEVVNDAVFDRNAAVMERLNCVIKLETNPASDTTHGDELIKMVANSVQADDDAYDICANSNYGTTQSMVQGLYLNLLKVENLNLEKDYWAKHLIDQSTIMGAVFGATGSISTWYLKSLYVMYFNRTLSEQYGITPDSIYEMVFNGEWTLDKMIELTKDIYSDENGNSLRDGDDIYGLAFRINETPDAYWSSCQIRMTSRNEEGGIQMDTDAEKLISVVERLNSFTWNDVGVVGTLNGRLLTTGDAVDVRDMFTQDRAVFHKDQLQATQDARFREMESDFGIIPYPKYDTVQDQYYTYLHDAFTNFCILTTVDDPEEIGAFLEAMACESHNVVMPAYYETALTTKYARDRESVETLNIIVSNVYLDTGWMFSTNLQGFPQKMLREAIWNNAAQPASIIAGLSKTMNSQLKRLNKAYADIAE